MIEMAVDENLGAEQAGADDVEDPEKALDVSRFVEDVGLLA